MCPILTKCLNWKYVLDLQETKTVSTNRDARAFQLSMIPEF